VKIRVWTSLARGVILESVRRKDLWVVAILGFLILISSSALGFFGMNGLQAFVKDLAGTVLGVFSAIIGILTSARMLPEEFKNRTLYPLLARPISRFDLIMGKWLGAVCVTVLSFLILCSLTALALLLFHVQFEAIMAQYVVGKILGLAVLCAVTLALSLYMTPSAAATISFVLAFGTSVISRGFAMAYDASGAGMRGVFEGINAILPHYSLFDFGSRAANLNWGPVPTWVIGALAIYAIIYSAAMLLISWLKFRTRPL
jgi:ABC-type transport system involved in multi-copper enzyme maturation permease subunit